MKLKEAREKGFDVIRGAYTGTTDDRADRWYVIETAPGAAIDKRGPGFATRKAALEHLGEVLSNRA